MKTLIVLEGVEVRLHLRYDLICETTQSSYYRTGRVKRKLRSAFNSDERDIINKSIIPKAKRWCLITGAPNEVTLTTREFNLWKQFEKFCVGV